MEVRHEKQRDWYEWMSTEDEIWPLKYASDANTTMRKYQSRSWLCEPPAEHEWVVKAVVSSAYPNSVFTNYWIESRDQSSTVNTRLEIVESLLLNSFNGGCSGDIHNFRGYYLRPGKLIAIFLLQVPGITRRTIHSHPSNGSCHVTILKPWCSSKLTFRESVMVVNSYNNIWTQPVAKTRALAIESKAGLALNHPPTLIP